MLFLRAKLPLGNGYLLSRPESSNSMISFSGHKRFAVISLSLEIVLLGAIFSPGLEVEGRLITHHWDISYVSGYPDGVLVHHILAINGEFPGPTIEARIGDILQITVFNNIQDGQNVTIHWHGLHQRGSPFEDGPSQITQCPIKHGSYQIYNFPLTQTGTYWYHSHVNSQYTEGLWGSLIIRGNPEPYKNEYSNEFLITLNDWYHTSAHENEKWYLSAQSAGAGPPYPHSVMMNGMGRYPCPEAIRECRNDLQHRPKYFLQRNKVYRLRIINTSGIAAFNFTIEGHTLRTIEIDGVDTIKTEPREAIFISAGQRYSCLLSTFETVLNWGRRNFLIRAHLRTDFIFRSPRPNINHNPDVVINEVTGVIEYSSRESTLGGAEGNILIPARERFDYTREHFGTTAMVNWNRLNFFQELELFPLDRERAPPYYNQQVVLNIQFFQDQFGVSHGSFNGTPMHLTRGRPQLAKMVRGEPIPQDGFPVHIRYNDIIQVVINNPGNGTHPIHLHGHHFWSMGQGSKDAGNYNPWRDRLTYAGHRRDTILIKQVSWLVIRFRADNPGVWTLHCHIDWHNLSGMAMTFVEGEERRGSLRIPAEARRVCAQHGVQI